jgi:hypothetical protein
MSAKLPTLRFQAAVSRHPWDDYPYHVITLPEEVVAQLPKKGRLRADLTVGPVTFNCGLLSEGKEGGLYIMVSKKLLGEMEVKVGEEVAMKLRLVPYDRVDVPEELEAAIDAVPGARALWDAVTPGKKRGHIAALNRAVRPETKLRRAKEIVESLFPLGGPSIMH